MDMEMLAAIKGLLDQQKTEILDEATHRMKVLLDAEVSTRFNLLAEELDLISGRLPESDLMEKMQDELDLHHDMLKMHTKEITSLKRAN